MLTSTFIHASGVGAVTESGIWSQGICNWQDYLARGSEINLAARHRATLAYTIEQSLEALETGQADYFARALPAREHWRAATAFPRIGYLDIETDGGSYGESITIIGLHDGWETRIYTKDVDLARFAFECQEFDGFVTFFGGGFDIPLLKKRFPVLEGVFADRFHIDLCPMLKALGYKGGLKGIERRLGINRRPEIDGLSGMDAVRLWRAHRQGGRGASEAIRLLRLYNEEDVVNMKTLLEFALPRMHKLAGMPCEAPILAHEPVLAEMMAVG
jgi:uncharacterized protein